MKGHKKYFLHNTITNFNDPDEMPLQNIVGKEENAGDQYFFLFPQCFLLFQCQISLFQLYLNCHLEILSCWFIPFCLFVGQGVEVKEMVKEKGLPIFMVRI